MPSQRGARWLAEEKQSAPEPPDEPAIPECPPATCRLIEALTPREIAELAAAGFLRGLSL